MSIRFACPTCNKSLAISDDKAGVRVACPSCKSPVRVPTNGQAAHHDGHAAKSTSPVGAAASTATGPKTSRGAGTPHALSEWGQVDAALADAVEVLDRDLPKQEEAQVRASLTAYAEAVPHHDLRGLGKQVTIIKAREFRTYRVVLDSLYERRHAARKEEPFQGSDVPPPKTTEQNIQVWTYPYPTGEEFRNGTKENVVPASKEVRPCSKCGGQKVACCDGCSGRKIVVCSNCGGSGDFRCGLCEGNGYRQVQTGTRTKTEVCPCGGKSQFHCWQCNNTGTRHREEPVYQAVPCTCGTGRRKCSLCDGHRQIRCPKCTGSGKLPCTPCKATGQMLSYLAVVQSFEASSQTITAPCTGIKDQRISGMLQQTDYSPFVTLATTEVPDALKLSSGAEQVRAGIIKAFDAAQSRISDESRLMRQRLQVGMASILEVGYQHEGKSYTAWFVGKQFRVHAPVSPITDTLQRMVKEAVKTWRKGDSKEATLLLREVMDMAGADPHCNAAYEEVRDTIPADLESKARWVRWKPFIIAGAVAFGIIFLIGLIGVGYALFRAKSGAGRPGGGVPPFDGVEQPGGQPPAFRPLGGGEQLAVVQFLDRNVAVPKNGKATVRLRVQRVGQVEGNLTLKLEAPRGLTVPPQVVVEQGRQDIEIEVTAGEEAGLFTIRAVPVGVNAGPFPAECRVAVGGTRLPSLPGR
jgi:phage FluMu protein Com